MKSFLLTKLFFSSTLFILNCLWFIPSTVANPSLTQSKQSSKTSEKYRCMYINDYPTTVAYTNRGPIKLIAWKNKYFSGSGYTPERRCQEVTTRFQYHSDAKNLRYISTGIMNRYNIICVSDEFGNCKPNGLLITIQHNQDAEKIMRDLFSVAARNSNAVINLSDGKNSGVITRVGSNGDFKETIDLDKFLAKSPVIRNIPDNLGDISPSEKEFSPNLSVSEENQTPPNKNKPIIENPWKNW